LKKSQRKERAEAKKNERPSYSQFDNPEDLYPDQAAAPSQKKQSKQNDALSMQLSIHDILECQDNTTKKNNRGKVKNVDEASFLFDEDLNFNSEEEELYGQLNQIDLDARSFTHDRNYMRGQQVEHPRRGGNAGRGRRDGQDDMS